jgi:hypothetical protein
VKIPPAFTLNSLAKLAAFLVLGASTLCGQDSSKAQSLPTAQQVMDHYVTAMGGHDAIFKHNSMTVRGKYEFAAQGLSLHRTVYYKDDKFLYDVVLPDGTHYQESFDGTVAWQLHPEKGPAISEGNEIKSKVRDADMHYPGRILDYFSSMAVVDVTNFEGAHLLSLKRN